MRWLIFYLENGLPQTMAKTKILMIIYGRWLLFLVMLGQIDKRLLTSTVMINHSFHEHV